MGYVSGKQWSNDGIKKEIYSVMNALDIDRMPTSTEIMNLSGNTSLCNAIARHGGFKFWSEYLNLNQNECKTRIGHNGEDYVQKILQDKGYKVERMSLKHPYDLLVNDHIKIDIKTSKKYTIDTWSKYSFNLEKENPTCDIYIFWCVDDNKVLVIPSKFLKQITLSITDKASKYDIYKDRFDYIDMYDSFYQSIV